MENLMIIEIKDLPSGQTIDKIDIHIDFQKGLATVVTPVPPVTPVTYGPLCAFYLLDFL